MDVFGSLDPPVAAALSNLGSTLDLSPQRLFDHWEAFACALKDQPDQPTLQHTGPFRNYLQMQMQKKPTLTKHSIEAHIRQRLAPRNTNAANQMTTPVKQKHLDMLSSPAFGASAFSSPPAPISSRKLPQSLSQPVHSPTTPALSASRLFSDRPNRGIIVDTFNPHVPYTTVQDT